MTEMRFRLPEDVVLRLQTLGVPGQRWMADLDRAVEDLEEAWQIRTGAVLSGGSESLILRAVRADASPAILKLRVPGAGEMTNEVAALRLADGRGYARLYAYDEARDALLVEALGAPLADVESSHERRLEALCATLRAAWLPLGESHGLKTGAEKALWLIDFIEETYARTDAPCTRAVIDRAKAIAEERAAAFDPARCVLVHGDPHAFNALSERDGGSPGQSRFIDPDGLFAQPEYDLGVLMREGNEALLAGDPHRLGRQLCDALAERAGVDAHAVWQWAFVERVSTGLMLVHIGMTDEGLQTLAVAEKWL